MMLNARVTELAAISFAFDGIPPNCRRS